MSLKVALSKNHNAKNLWHIWIGENKVFKNVYTFAKSTFRLQKIFIVWTAINFCKERKITILKSLIWERSHESLVVEFDTSGRYTKKTMCLINLFFSLCTERKQCLNVLHVIKNQKKIKKNCKKCSSHFNCSSNFHRSREKTYETPYDNKLHCYYFFIFHIFHHKVYQILRTCCLENYLLLKNKILLIFLTLCLTVKWSNPWHCYNELSTLF